VREDGRVRTIRSDRAEELAGILRRRLDENRFDNRSR
jgi:hypothetical protein